MSYYLQDDQNQEKHVYYVSKALLEPELRYKPLAHPNSSSDSTKVTPYFQAHTIVVLTSYPIWLVLHKLDLSGRMLRSSIELSEYDIAYKSQTTLKEQVLVDFVAKFTEGVSLDNGK